MAESAVAERVDSGSASEWGKMTPEQQNADIEQGIAQVKGYEAPVVDEAEQPEKPENETKETPVVGDETPAVDDAALAAEDTEAKGKGEGETEESESADWRDEETKEYATMMGVSEDELSDFGSREELDRALRISDRKAFEAGEAAESPVVEKPKPVIQQSEKPETAAQDDPFADLSRFKLGEEFDEKAAKPINDFVDSAVATIKDLQTRVARFEQQSQRQATADIHRRAFDSLHSLGNVELFGKPGEKATKEQAANVAKAIDAHFTHARGLFASGRQAAPTPAFLKAAVNLAFGDQISKQQRQQLTDKLRKQAAKRTGGGTAKIAPKPKGAMTDLETLKADPDLDALFSQLTAERKG